MIKITKSLYWRFTITFLLGLLIVTSAYIYFTINTSEMYFQESSQRLNYSIAKHITKFTKLYVDGKVNEEEVKATFHNIMILNPSVEVYLLDTEGKILTYFAPKGNVQLEKVSLAPIHSFIKDEGKNFIMGDDPRNPGVQKVFSAAKVKEEEKQLGYLYVVLASEEFTGVNEMLGKSYMLGLAGKSFLITFFAALVIGLIVIWYLTRNLKKITDVVQRFQNGEHSARIELKSKGELTYLADNFNNMADKLVKYINEIKSVDELRKELIANVSHDLRTPLAAIQGYAETIVIKDKDLTDEQRKKYTNTILRGTERIKKLVDELFELSKLETHQVKAQFEHFSLQELVYDIAQKYELLAQKKDIKIETKIPHQLPMIYADIALIDRVLQNLVDNALKFTNSGDRISIELIPHGKLLKVIVADTGLGIKEDELPYIFERYRKGKLSNKEGVGLGLAIVKKILELHKSTITVNSKFNEGTVFTFELQAAN